MAANVDHVGARIDGIQNGIQVTRWPTLRISHLHAARPIILHITSDNMRTIYYDEE
jgi:hypothetical protein